MDRSSSRALLFALCCVVLACTSDPAPVSMPSRVTAASPMLTPLAVAPNWELLDTALASSDLYARRAALETLASAPPEPRTLAALAHALGDPEESVRLASIESLGELAVPRALVLLRSVESDSTERLTVRVAASAAARLHPYARTTLR